MARHLLLDKIDNAGANGGKIATLVKTVEVIEATIDNQKVFTIPMQDFDETVHLFEVRIGSVWFSNERYDIVNDTIVLKDTEEGIEKGRKLSFIFTYLTY